VSKTTCGVLFSFLVSGVVAATPAFAGTIDYFTVSEPATSTTYTFSLPSTPTPGTFNVSPGSFFEFSGVQISYDGAPSVAGNIFFFDSGVVGLYLDISSPPVAIYDEESPSLFSGSLNNPTFNIGSFNGVDDSHTSDVITVTISDPPGVAPEPGSLVLLGTGALGLAGVIRKRFVS
jgi:PEP-CTERM motif